jgi:hypothetical protein
MKKRARTIGEGGLHTFLKNLQEANAARVHLMGHSFGCIVVSGMVGGPDGHGPLLRPVSSLALVQGAVSLWSYSPQIPLSGAGAGYFSHVLGDGKIAGPLVTTRSKNDDAVGFFYPLASRLRGSAAFAPGSFPEYGAIGAYGIQGLPAGQGSDLEMLAEDGDYGFEQGRVYNLNGSQYIAKKEGASGAHSDIAGPQVAHVLWETALASTKP